MKNRKLIVVAFMLAACMIVGVGYALVTDTMDIGGAAEVSLKDAEETFNQNVYFAGVVVDGAISDTGVTENDQKKYTANINANNNDKAQFTVYGLTNEGESVDIIFRIVNEGDLDADLMVKSCTNSNTEYFDVKYFYISDENEIQINTSNAGQAGNTSFYTLTHTDAGLPNPYVDIVVRVTLRKAATVHVSATTTFEFDATSDDNDASGVQG